MRWKRILLILASFLAITVAFCLFSLRFLPNTELVRGSVQEKLVELTGRQIAIGSIKFTGSISDIITLTLEKIVVVSPDGKKIASVEQLVLVPSLKELFKRELCIKSAIINGLWASFERTAEGIIKDPFENIISSDHAKIRIENVPAIDEKRPPPADSGSIEPASSARSDSLKWSVKSLKIVDSRVDWIDRRIGSGVTVSLSSISGKLIQKRPGEPIFVRLTSSLSSNAKTKETDLITLDGQILPATDFSSVERVAVSLVAEKLPVNILQPYFPDWWTGTITQLSLRGRAEWEKKQTSKFLLTTEMISKSAPAAKIDCKGQLITDDSFDLRQISFSAETEALPLNLMVRTVSTDIPLDLEETVFKGKIKGEWNKEAPWKLQGIATLENIMSAGMFKGISHPLRLDAEFRADPDNLFLDKTEIWESNRLASIIGKIEKPFSNDRIMDLAGNTIIRPQWLHDFGINLPKSVDMKGPLVLQAHVQGRPNSPLIDLKIDMTNVAVKWLPYLEKPAGNGSRVTLKGKINPATDKKNSFSGFNGEVHLNMVGTNVRFADDVPWFQKSAINFNSKLLFHGKIVDLKNASVALKGGPASGEMLSATANITGLGSNPKFEGTASARVNSGITSVFGTEKSAGFILKGDSNLKGSFSGDTNQINWALELPLTNLDISVNRTFRKPTGVAGHFKASGKWSKDSLALTSSQITLPGVSVVAEGQLNGQNGNLKQMKVELKKANAKDIAKFIPAMDGYKISGPLEGLFHIRPGEKGIVTSSTVRLLSVDLQPDKSALSLEKVQGKVEIQGTNLVADDIAARVQGAIEGPLKAKFTLNNISSIDDMFGRVSVQIGSGLFKAEKLRNLLNQAKILIGTLLNPAVLEKKSDLMEFESLTGDFDVKSRTAYTENLRLKGQGFSLGVVGKLRLDTSSIDAVAGIHTITTAGEVLGKIPGVQKFVKKHEDLLKITGLDKELKRLGLQVPTDQETKPDTEAPAKTPVTVIVKLRGPASSPEVLPILETAVDKETLARLKSLLH